MRPSPSFALLFLAELILANAAKRTLEISGNILPLGAGSDTTLRVTLFFIVGPTANIANVRHIVFSFRFIMWFYYTPCAGTFP